MAKLIKTGWLLVCISLSVWGIRMGGETNLGVVYLIGFLTMPLGLLVYVVSSLLISLFNKLNPHFGVTYDSTISIVVYSLAIVVGYFQWFVLLPKIIKKVGHERSLKIYGLSLIALVAISYGLYRFYIYVFPSYL